MNSMKLYFSRLFYPIAIFWWVTWSKVYRWLWKRDHDFWIELDSNLSLVDAEEKMALLKWSPDTGKELWDACGPPHWVQYVLRQIQEGNTQPMGSLDCDDFAAWCCKVLDKKYLPCILSVSWVSSSTEILGHAVCLCKRKDGMLFHMGNWGTVHSFPHLKDLCSDMLRRVHGKEIIGWSLIDADLKVITWGRGMPTEYTYLESIFK
jgi:hypothetical protein